MTQQRRAAQTGGRLFGGSVVAEHLLVLSQVLSTRYAFHDTGRIAHDYGMRRVLARAHGTVSDHRIASNACAWKDTHTRSYPYILPQDDWLYADRRSVGVAIDVGAMVIRVGDGRVAKNRPWPDYYRPFAAEARAVQIAVTSNLDYGIGGISPRRDDPVDSDIVSKDDTPRATEDDAPRYPKVPPRDKVNTTQATRDTYPLASE